MSRTTAPSHDLRDQVLRPARQYLAHDLEAPAFQRDPDFVAAHLPTIGQVVSRYFAAEVAGLEHVPDEGPFLIVSNHSGGFLMPDAWALASSLVDRFGTDRPIYTLMLDAAFAIPGFGAAMRRLGALPASMANAERAVGEGAGVLVYPGGDHEVYRPWVERNHIQFHGHAGFVRLALRHGIPVVPAVSHGSHDSIVVLARGERLGRAIGLDRLRIGVFPILAGPFGVAPVFVPQPPLPTKIRVEVLAPVDWSALGPDDAHDADVVQACYDEVTGTLQGALDRLARDMPVPLATRLATAVGMRR